jgi:hypothetical protein
MNSKELLDRQEQVILLIRKSKIIVFKIISNLINLTKVKVR